MPIVDSHPHIYSPDRDAYPTIELPWEPGEPAAAEDLKKQMDAVGVDRAVFIQTSTFYGHDNRYIMDSAKQHSEWACGVATLDPDDASHIELLESAVTESNIRGLRGTVDSINQLATPNVYRLWRKAMSLGIPVNCMVMDDLDRVPELELMARDLGDLKIVIDHCFMLNTRQKTEETLAALERLSALPNVYAKLTSGTHGSYRVYPFPDMHDPLKRVIDAFGPNRCVWGSNFPNVLWSKGATYAQNLHLFVKELGLSLSEKAGILGLTAMSLWFPEEHASEEDNARKQKERTEQESIRAAQSEEPEQVEEEEDRAKGHRAEILKMADLIAAEGSVEGPIAEEVDDAEIAGILESAKALNAVIDSASADAEAAPPDFHDEESSHELEVDPEDSVSANIEKLLSAHDRDSDETERPEAPAQESSEPASQPDGLDIAEMREVADQLSAMLEAIEGIDSNIADLSADLENSDHDERDSA